MKKVKALILGTDDNSYSVARSYYDSFNDKALVVGAGILPPFYHTKIADVNYKIGFSKDDDLFVSFLNEQTKKYPNTKFVIFGPNEIYLNLIAKNMDRFEFDFETAYPDSKLFQSIYYKSDFYKYLDTIGLAYPKTQIINKDNIESLDIEADIFMKPDDFGQLYYLDYDRKQKGYHLKNKEEAIEILKGIYLAGYTSNMIVQKFINGEDGSEYSLNGYRASDGKISMVLARNILSDKRALSIGNHIVQIDHNDQKMYEIAEKLTNSLNYVGLFNIDFKKDSETGEIFVLEMNQRQGRTFYYSILAGVNLIEIAINEKAFSKTVEKRTQNKFRLMTLNEKFLQSKIDKDLLKEFNDPDRVKNSSYPNIKKEDNSFIRNLKLKNKMRKAEKQIFGK